MNHDLHDAIKNGDLEIISRVVSINTDNLESLNRNFDTPLTLAIHLKRLDIVKMLLVSGAQVNYNDSIFPSPLLVACHINDGLIIDSLISFGAKFMNIYECKTAYNVISKEFISKLHFNSELVPRNSNCYICDSELKNIVFTCTECLNAIDSCLFEMESLRCGMCRKKLF